MVGPHPLTHPVHTHPTQVHATAANTVRLLGFSAGAPFDSLSQALADPALRRHPASALVGAGGGPQSICETLAAACFARPAAEVLWQITPGGVAATPGVAVAGDAGESPFASHSQVTAASSILGKEEAEKKEGEGGPGVFVSPEAALVLEPFRASRRLRQMVLCLLAESVSRGCRKLVRSLAAAEVAGSGSGSGSVGGRDHVADEAVTKRLLLASLGIKMTSVLAQPSPDGEGLTYFRH